MADTLSLSNASFAQELKHSELNSEYVIVHNILHHKGLKGESGISSDCVLGVSSRLDFPHHYIFGS